MFQEVHRPSLKMKICKSTFVKTNTQYVRAIFSVLLKGCHHALYKDFPVSSLSFLEVFNVASSHQKEEVYIYAPLYFYYNFDHHQKYNRSNYSG